MNYESTEDGRDYDEAEDFQNMFIRLMAQKAFWLGPSICGTQKDVLIMTLHVLDLQDRPTEAAHTDHRPSLAA
jgi:hypothetical protein